MSSCPPPRQRSLVSLLRDRRSAAALGDRHHLVEERRRLDDDAPARTRQCLVGVDHAPGEQQVAPRVRLADDVGEQVGARQPRCIPGFTNGAPILAPGGRVAQVTV